MENYREKLKIQNLTFGICAFVLALFCFLSAAGEAGIVPFFVPAGDSHWQSSWNGFITGASCGVLALLVVSLIRNIRALKDEKKLKKLYVKTHDERTLQIQILARNTAMQVLLIGGLVATVIAGYFNITVSITILCCTFVCSLTSLAFVGYYSKKL